tara:strand:+ start:206 stop:838 length:633 start_codon:yes stop_codon:yes gene_type:complete
MLTTVTTLLIASSLYGTTVADDTVHWNIKDIPPTYQEIVDEAVFNCPNRKWQDVDEKLLWKLVEVEKKHNVPPRMRGMLLAAACMESGYNPLAKGDWRKVKRKRKKIAKAIGILQMWPWYERAYKIDRTKPVESADAWLRHIIKQIPSVKKQCKVRTVYRVWSAAWAKGIRYPKKGGRCYDRVKHLRLMKKWRRNITRDRKVARNNGDGC